MEKVHAGIMIMAIKGLYNNGPFYSGRKSVIFFKHLNSSEELLGIIPTPNLVYAVALDVKQRQLFIFFGSFLLLIGNFLD